MRSYIVNIAGIDHSVKLTEKTAKRLKAKPVESPADRAKAREEAVAKAKAEQEAKEAAEAKAAVEEAKSAKPENKAKAPNNK